MVNELCELHCISLLLFPFSPKETLNFNLKQSVPRSYQSAEVKPPSHLFPTWMEQNLENYDNIEVIVRVTKTGMRSKKCNHCDYDSECDKYI